MCLKGQKESHFRFQAVCLFIHLHTRMKVTAPVCKHRCVSCRDTHTHIYIYIYTYTYIYLFVYLRIYLCIYTQSHRHTHTERETSFHFVHVTIYASIYVSQNSDPPESLKERPRTPRRRRTPRPGGVHGGAALGLRGVARQYSIAIEYNIYIYIRVFSIY